MAFPEVNEEVVYLTAGAAVPVVIDNMLLALLNDDFATAYHSILKARNLPLIIVAWLNNRFHHMSALVCCAVHNVIRVRGVRCGDET
jgi:hypothetical protein